MADFDALRFIPVSDVGTRAAGVCAGDYDYAKCIPGDLFAELDADAGVKTFFNGGPFFGLVFLKSSDGTLKENLALRRANGSFGPEGNVWYSAGRAALAPITLAAPHSRARFRARMAVIIGGWQRDCGACRGRRDWHALGQFNRLGHFLMRGVDVLMAFPALLMALVLITLLERSVVNTIIVIAIVYATTTARSLYGMTLKLKAAVFVDAAICSGAGHPSILFRQILPNLVSPLLVQASFIFAFAQLQAAALDFLGLGLPPEVPGCGKSLTSLAIMGLWVEAGGFPTKAIFWATPKFASPETRSIASGLRAPMAPLPSYR